MKMKCRRRQHGNGESVIGGAISGIAAEASVAKDIGAAQLWRRRKLASAMREKREKAGKWCRKAAKMEYHEISGGNGRSHAMGEVGDM